jgi:hypothetical protein
MTIWSVHKVGSQRSADEGFQGWKLVLPGRPQEVARANIQEPMTEERAFALLARHMSIGKHARISLLYDRKSMEEPIGFMLLESGVPCGFVVKVQPTDAGRKMPVK